MKKLLPGITDFISTYSIETIDERRREVLNNLAKEIANCIKNHQIPSLVFICTHNSRRSQLAELWSKVAATVNNLNLYSYSGGTEVTELNQYIIDSLESVGFGIIKTGEDNPHYQIYYSFEEEPKILYSKEYVNATEKLNDFIAVITCSSANESCPIIEGTDKRFYLSYDDPGAYDKSENREEKYSEASKIIGSEMFYLFSQVRELH